MKNQNFSEGPALNNEPLSENNPPIPPSNTSAKRRLIIIISLAVIIIIGSGLFGFYYFQKIKWSGQQEPNILTNENINNGGVISETPPAEPTQRELPDFIYTIRGYNGGGRDDFQISALKEMGFTYVHDFPALDWAAVEPRDDDWKWGLYKARMDEIARNGLKNIPFLMVPKVPPTWVNRETLDPAKYEEFAYEFTNQFKNHPAWSGIISVWGGSSDVYDPAYDNIHNPRVQIPLLNAAYDGIKRADPNTVVVGFNMATTALSTEQYEWWHSDAFRLGAKFDWFGYQTHNIIATQSPDQNLHSIPGLQKLRDLLARFNYRNKPVFINEGGYSYDTESGGQIQAEQLPQYLILGRTLNMRGWVLFTTIWKDQGIDEGLFGVFEPFSEGTPPRPRPAFYSLKTLLNTVNFPAYKPERIIQGELGEPNPYIIQFQKANDANKKLWIVLSPRVNKNEPIEEDIIINISPFTRAKKITMMGEESVISADRNGSLTVRSTSAPVYIIAE